MLCTGKNIFQVQSAGVSGGSDMKKGEVFMKKVFALLLVSVMLLSFAACGEVQPAGTTQPSQVQTTPVTPPSVPANGETLQTSCWSLVYDPAVWSYDPDDLYEYDDQAAVTMIIPDGEDDYSICVEIDVCLDDADNFRRYLKNFGFDAYAYAVDKAYEPVNVGGVDCLKQETTYWGDPCVRYIGRLENASVTVFIEIIGDANDSRLAQLLAGLSIKTEDIGNVDYPWPWDGTPFSAANASAFVGTYKVESQWLPITDCVIADETFDNAITVADGKAYLVVDGIVKQYAYDGNSLVFERDLDIGDGFDQIQTANDGTVWVSAFMQPLVSLKNGEQTGSFEGADSVTMHPSGTWGISWFSGPDCEKITVSGGALTASEISFKEVSVISTVIVDEDYIYVCGYAADDSGHKVFVYDLDGSLQMVLTDEDGDSLGSVTFIAQTANGFLGLDGNMRDIVLWAADGTWLGALEDSDLFGTSYPWFCGGTKLSDGSILVVMTEDRADKSAMELVAFRLSGF